MWKINNYNTPIIKMRKTFFFFPFISQNSIILVCQTWEREDSFSLAWHEVFFVMTAGLFGEAINCAILWRPHNKNWSCKLI